jgi:signal transduction histidine kinase
MLDDLGLVATLEWHAEEFTTRTGVHCTWLERPERVNLERGKATAVFRIFQEILTNIARHSGATTVKMVLRPDDDTLLLEVTDDGKGFKEPEIGRPASLGLLGMRERALAAGGTVEIKSAPGKGTTVSLRVPHHSETNNGA